jgi:hypothetical protein
MRTFLAIIAGSLLAVAFIGCDRQPPAKPSDTAPTQQANADSHDRSNAMTLQLCVAARPEDSFLAQEAREQLARGSMSISSQGQVFRWVPLRRLSDLTDDPYQLQAIQEDAEGAFARNIRLVVAREGDVYQILVNVTPESCLTLTPQTLRGASMTLDALGRDAIALEMTDDGKAAEARLINHVDRIVVVLNDQVIACKREPPWICDQQQTSASKQQLAILAKSIDKHFRQR